MKNKLTSQEALLAEVNDLRFRLDEAEETLRAIRSGEVDALIVAGPQGDQIFTLESADHPYRIFIEEMNEGAVTLSEEGVILFCNSRFATIVGTPLDRVLGAFFADFAVSADLPVLQSLLQDSLGGQSSGEMIVRSADGTCVPLYLSLKHLPTGSAGVVCLVATDLTKVKQNEAELRRAYDELEKRVTDRTATLARTVQELEVSRAAALNMMEDAEEARQILDAANRQLQKEIADRKRAEIELRDSRQFFHTTIDSLKGHICVLDETGTIVMTNRAWDDFALANIGDPQCVSEGVNYLSVCDSVAGPDLESATSFARGIRAVLSGESKEFSMEYPCHSPTEKRWFLGTVSPLHKGDSRWVVISHDNITERKQIEEALRQKQTMLARTESITHTGSWEWETASDKVMWSDELFRIFQRDPADGAPSFAEHPRFYHPEDMQRLTAAVEAAVSHGAPYELELRAIRKDGLTRVCLARGQAEMGPEGRAVRLFGSFQDITERKQAEQALRESEKKYRQIVETAGEGVWMIDAEGNTTFANQRMAEMLGYSVGEMLGLSLFAFMDEDGKAIAAAAIERRRQGIKEQHDFRFCRKDGTDL
jgi:PAS domain S-box-containing protein